MKIKKKPPISKNTRTKTLSKPKNFKIQYYKAQTTHGH